MDKITSITPQQEAELARTLRYWLAVGRSTAVMDRGAATEAICAMYQAIGKERPKVLFFSSPAMCLLAWSSLKTLASENSALRSQLWLQLESQLWSQLGSQLGSQLESQLNSQLESELNSQLGSQLESQLWSQLWLQVGSQLRSQLRLQLGSQLWSQLGSQLGSQLNSQLESELNSQLGSQLESQLWSQLWLQVGSQLRSQLRLQLGSQLESQIRNRFAGNQWCAWEVFYEYCNRIGVVYTNEQKALLSLWINQSQHCHWWFPYEGIVLASERPEICAVDDLGRLHSTKGAAIKYSDAWGIHAVHGVRVEPWIIEDSGRITPALIDDEQNAEVRRVMIERFGTARYIKESGASVVHELPGNYYVKGLAGAKLYRKERERDSPIIMIAVKNQTAEPDGSVRDYFLRVQPDAYDGLASTDCHAAMTSTWRNKDMSLYFKSPHAYAPAFES
jgi:hypothetical protein